MSWNWADESQLTCPYCWEPLAIILADEGEQDFVIDCEVCCRPILVRVRTHGREPPVIEARRENE